MKMRNYLIDRARYLDDIRSEPKELREKVIDGDMHYTPHSTRITRETTSFASSRDLPATYPLSGIERFFTTLLALGLISYVYMIYEAIHDYLSWQILG